MSSTRSPRPWAAPALAAALVLVATPACTQSQRAERDGKKAGEAVCDVREADDPTEVEAARVDAIGELEDLADEYLFSTAEDRADVVENVEDLAEHVLEGSETLARQDVAVISRSLDNIQDDVDTTSSAAASGFTQAVDDCS